MASDHRAHANAPRAYTRVHPRERDNEASIGLLVRVERGRGPSYYKRCKRRAGVRGRRGNGRDSQRMRGERQYPGCGTSIEGWCRRIKGGNRSLTCHLVRVTFAMPRLILQTLFRVRSRTGRTADKASLQFERHEFAGWIIRRRSTKAGKHSRVSRRSRPSVSRARIDGGVLVERMIAATSARIKSLSEISNLDRQSIIYQCDVSRLYRNNGYRNLLRDYVPELNCYGEKGLAIVSRCYYS